MGTAEKVRERPIPFTTDMVRAILEGRKTQTRREIKPQPDCDRIALGITSRNSNPRVMAQIGGKYRIPCKYGCPGDRLWVKETYSVLPAWQGPGDETPDYVNYVYKAIASEIEAPFINFETPKWKSPRFMPKEAARLFLEITDIRMERLWAITNEDAIKEGVEAWPDGNFKSYHGHPGKYANARDSFLSLWESIKGKESYESNPWVWVITFKNLRHAY